MTPKEDELGEFRKVTFEKERKQILDDMSAGSVTVLGQTLDNFNCVFNVRRVKDGLLILSFKERPPRALKKDEPMSLTFGLGDGQYYCKTTVSFVSDDEAYFPVGTELYRLQRRNNFRAYVPTHTNINLTLKSWNTDIVKFAARVVDLSAGGARVTWPADTADKVKVGQQISGSLSLPNGQNMEVFATIKHIWPKQPDGNLPVGMEFQNLSLRDEQALLFICMALHRDSLPITKTYKV